MNNSKIYSDEQVMPYQFSEDWFSSQIPVFEKHLSSFRGRPANFLEIGTYEGRSATWLLDNILTNHGSRLICIDRVQQPSLKANLEATGALSKVAFYAGLSRDGLMKLPANVFDFAYVDGSHSACDVLEDAVLVFRKIKIGGIIAFDDFLWDDPKHNQRGTPKIPIEAFLHCYSHKIEILENGYQVWIRKKMQ